MLHYAWIQTDKVLLMARNLVINTIHKNIIYLASLLFKKREEIECEKLTPYVERVLEFVGHPEAFTTDESQVSDFFISEINLSTLKYNCQILYRLKEGLGFSVRESDRIVDIAKKLKEKNTNSSDIS